MKNAWIRWMVALAVLAAAGWAAAAQSDLDQKIDSNIADWVGTYKHLHANPELSTQEKETSALVAGTLRKLGYEVTDHFGEYEDPEAGVLRRSGSAEEWSRTNGLRANGTGCAAGAREHRFAVCEQSDRETRDR